MNTIVSTNELLGNFVRFQILPEFFAHGIQKIRHLRKLIMTVKQ